MVTARIYPGDGDPRHGSSNGYNNLGCRCRDCTDAFAVRHREWMHADPRRPAKHALAERLRQRALEPVTLRENLRRGEGWPGRQARQTHCKRGREFTDENTRIIGDGGRQCRECESIYPSRIKRNEARRELTRARREARVTS